MKYWLAPGNLHIEPALVGDASALAGLHSEGFRIGWQATEFAAFLADPDRTPALVACDAKRRISGFIQFRLAGPEAELITIAVSRRWRGRGLGRALLVAGLEEMVASGVSALFLEVEEANSAALALYRRAGFEKVGERVGYYLRPDGSRATALVMRRALE